jgi:hypothetical protein
MSTPTHDVRGIVTRWNVIVSFNSAFTLSLRYCCACSVPVTTAALLVAHAGQTNYEEDEANHTHNGSDHSAGGLPSPIRTFVMLISDQADDERNDAPDRDYCANYHRLHGRTLLSLRLDNFVSGKEIIFYEM